MYCVRSWPGIPFLFNRVNYSTIHEALHLSLYNWISHSSLPGKIELMNWFVNHFLENCLHLKWFIKGNVDGRVFDISLWIISYYFVCWRHLSKWSKCKVSLSPGAVLIVLLTFNRMLIDLSTRTTVHCPHPSHQPACTLAQLDWDPIRRIFSIDCIK